MKTKPCEILIICFFIFYFLIPELKCKSEISQVQNYKQGWYCFDRKGNKKPNRIGYFLQNGVTVTRPNPDILPRMLNNE